MKIPCQFPGCEVEIEHTSEAVAVAMFQSHVVSHSQVTTSAKVPSQRLPPIPRPEVKQNISEEDWISFMAEWTNFKHFTEIGDNPIPDQLYQCCDKNLAKLLIREQPDIVSRGEKDLLAAMKKLAVIHIATSVRRTNLLALKQKHGETFREFYANVKATAATCDFRVKCYHECCKDNCAINYTSNVVKDVLVAGIADADIRKDVLAWAELDLKDDKEVVAFVECKEMAQAAWSGEHTSGTTSGTAVVSTYKKGSKPESESKSEQSTKQKLLLKGKCKKCNRDISLYKKFTSGRMNSTAFTLCRQCYLEGNAQTSSIKVAEAVSASAVESFFIGGN